MREALANDNPELISEWSDRNYPMTPFAVSSGSSKKVWWIGRCGHEWQALVKNRARLGCGCPICSGNLIVAGVNDLKSQESEISAEWDYEKNEALSPETVSAHSNRKVWWRCSRGHSWAARIADRVDGSGCPFCLKDDIQEKKQARINARKEELSERAFLRSMRLTSRERHRIERSFPEMAVRYYSKNAGIRILEKDEDTIGLPIRFYFPDINGAIELNSKHYPMKYGTIHEVCENRLCYRSGISLVRIIDSGCYTNTECRCIYRADDSIESLENALISAFDYLNIISDINFKRDYREICQISESPSSPL